MRYKTSEESKKVPEVKPVKITPKIPHNSQKQDDLKDLFLEHKQFITDLCDNFLSNYKAKTNPQAIKDKERANLLKEKLNKL